MRRLGWTIGLGLMVGAVLQRPAGAQIDTSRAKQRDSVRIAIPPHADSLIKKDSLARDTIPAVPTPPKRDTIKAPLAHAEEPAVMGIGRRLHWDRAALFATGALTVQDLLDREAGTGIATFRAGWIAAPATGAYLGDARHIRVFYDGLEMQVLDPRSGTALDLTQINLWSLDDVTIEQSAMEVRVYIRSWRVTNTSASTRTDVVTGDQQTNLYRGFFGRRYDRGAALQFAGQQYGTTPSPLYGTSSDQLGLLARIGWASRDFSADAFATRTSHHRGVIRSVFPADSILQVESSRTDSYLRAAYGDPDVSPYWGQLMAVASKYDYTGVLSPIPVGTPAPPAGTPPPPLDSGVFQSQYIATAGVAGYRGRLSATERIVSGPGKGSISTPSIRASYAPRESFSVSAFVEGRGADSIGRRDIVAQVTPFSFLSMVGSAGESRDERVADSTRTTRYLRGELGLRIHGIWLVGGVVRRDSALLAAPRIFDTSWTRVASPTVTGVTAGVRGRVWRIVNVNLSAIRWTDSLGTYRPQYQTRSEVFIATNLINRFPTNNFGLLASAVHEYRSGTRFPLGTSGVETVAGYRTISTLLEIRIVSASVFWQFRNVLGENYTTVPGFAMPRQMSIYGVRWQFWN
jgi:hypothetical protein